MFTIHLHNLRFFAQHGMYREEKLLGNEFEVNASVTIAAEEKIGHIAQTINYVIIYEMIKKRMAIPTPLLETLAQELVEEIYQHDKRIGSISISIRKLNPPIENFSGSVGISLVKHFTT